MEEKDQDNIYIYSEEEETASESVHDLDDSGPNYSQVNPNEIKEEVAPEDSEIHSKRQIFSLLVKILSNPVESWKAVRRSRLSADKVLRDCYYPLVGILTASQFAEYFYSPRIGIAQTIENALFAFVSFFFGYFCIIILLKTLFPGEIGKTFDTDFGKVFVIFNLSTFCFFLILTELLPMLWAILIFLPLWTVYSISRGARFFQFPPNRQITYTGLLCLIIVGTPIFLGWLLDKIFPHIS